MLIMLEAGQLTDLPAAVEVATFRIAVEAVNNAVRHSGAQNWRVRLGLDNPGGLLVEVCAELSRAKTKAQAELSRINGDIELLDTRKRRTGQLAGRESLRQASEANESIGWRRPRLLEISMQPT